MTSRRMFNDLEDAVRNASINDLVEHFPQAMPVLSSYGIDLCCGGAHTVPGAAEAHGHDPEAMIDEVINAVNDGKR